MNGKLAIFSSNIGTRSETFIRRHIEYVPPRKRVVLAHNIVSPSERTWGVDCPIHLIKPASFLQKGARFLRRRIGYDDPDHMDVGQISDFLIDQKVGILWGHYLNESWPLIRIAKELGLRLFVHALGYDLSRIFRDPAWRKRYTDYRHASGVIVLNRIMRERLTSIGVPSEKIHIIPCGVEVPEENPTSANCGDVIRCLAVGRMVEKKAPLNLLKSFHSAIGRNPSLHLDFVGNGPLFKPVQNYVLRHDLQRQVKLHGGQSHQFVLDLMSGADIFLQHSLVDPKTGDEEGLPVAILEAMAMGLPVVSTRHAGIPEAVIDGLNGLLVEEGDVYAMGQSISELAEDKQRRSKMGEKGWLLMRDRFRWQKEREALCNIMGFCD